MIPAIILLAAVALLAGFAAWEIIARRRRSRQDDEPAYLPAPAGEAAPDPVTGDACKACSPLDFGPCTCTQVCGWMSCMGGHGIATAETPPAYEPHGIDSAETLAALVARAGEDARAAQEAAETEPWGEWDEPGVPLVSEPAPPAPPSPPPPMPYPGDVSRIMVHQIDYPDPADLSPDKDRQYRAMLRRVGVATGTRTSLEDTGVWALPALEPGDGTGVPL